ncbi:MAG: hypothetical protein HN368_19370 [Spirochaetales bacterium]|jgi:hypothetical protein|nr:hypothetical protein [Spirochaetales bacterium]
MSNVTNTRRLLCDWQMPDILNLLDIDTDFFVDQLVKVGADTIEFTAKSAFGSALYPTRIGRRCSGMPEGRDIFGEVCNKAKAKDIKVIAYFNVLLDYDVSGERAGWLQRDAEGKTLVFEGYPMFCMSAAPYLTFISAHMREVAELYEIDGIMLDIQYWHKEGCFCEHCSKKFLEDTGRDLSPSSFSIQDWLALGEFQRRTRRDFLLTMKDGADQARFGLEWSWNGSGNFSVNHELDEHISSYGSEAHPPAYDMCSAKAKWIRSTGKPFELWMPESIGSWGHHTVTTAATLKGTCALALANGGAVTVNHAPVPTGDYGGRAAPAVYELITEVFSWIQERDKFCTDTRPVADFGILHSETNTIFERSRRAAAASGCGENADFPHWMVGQAAAYACAAIIDQVQVPYGFINGEFNLEKGRVSQNAKDFAGILLPNVGYMSEETAEYFRTYVTEGGTLLSFYTSSLLDTDGHPGDNFLLADVLGVDYKGLFDFSASYLGQFSAALADALPDIPLLFKDTGYQQTSKNRALICETRMGAEVLAYLVEPVLEAEWSTDFHIFHDHAPPGKKTGYPGIVRNNFGKGVSIFLAVPLLESFVLQPNPWYRNLVRACLRLLDVHERVVVDGPSSARIVANENEEGWLVHVIRLQQETGGILLEADGKIDVSCTCLPPWPVDEVRDEIDGTSLEFVTASDGSVRFSVENVTCHSIVLIKRGVQG